MLHVKIVERDRHACNYIKYENHRKKNVSFEKNQRSLNSFYDQSILNCSFIRSINKSLNFRKP